MMAPEIFEAQIYFCSSQMARATDTTSSAGNTITKTCSGSGAPFLYGHDLTFSSTDYDRKGAPV